MDDNRKRSLCRQSCDNISFTETSLGVESYEFYQGLRLEPWKQQANIKDRWRQILGRKEPSRYAKQEERTTNNHSSFSISKHQQKVLERKRRRWIQLPELQKVNIVMPLPSKSKMSSKCSLSMFRNQFAGKPRRRMNTESCYDLTQDQRSLHPKGRLKHSTMNCRRVHTLESEA